jgi:hypothetical protein
MSHELIAGAASFEAMKAYEDHVARNGPHPPSPQTIFYEKEIYPARGNEMLINV